MQCLQIRAGGTIILKLRLFTATKQMVRVEDYMEIKHKGYNDLTTDEKGWLYGLLSTEIKNANSADAYLQANAIVNIIFNRISSPYYGGSSITSVLSSPETAALIGFKKFSENFGMRRRKST